MTSCIKKHIDHNSITSITSIASIASIASVASITSIVFSGGGSKGYCYIGVVKYLDEMGILPNLKTYAGTSIGSLFATLLCIGYSYKDMYDAFIKFDYSDFHRINIVNFLYSYGLDDFSGMEGLIIKLFTLKNISVTCTFAELYKQTSKRLCINAVSMNSKRVIYFNYETCPDMKIIIALKASMAIPYIFIPVKYENDMYIDGGLLENFMINYKWFKEDTENKDTENKDTENKDTENKEKISILGINLISCQKDNNQNVTDIYEFSQELFSCIFNNIHLQSKNNMITKIVKIVTIQCQNNAFDFDLDAENKQILFKLGYDSMLHNLNSFL